jgi:hypothetical protein
VNDRLIMGYDLGGPDWSAVAIVQRASEGFEHLRVIHAEVFEPMYDGVMRKMRSLLRDYSRPRGYSQSHWRKLWKQTHCE